MFTQTYFLSIWFTILSAWWSFSAVQGAQRRKIYKTDVSSSVTSRALRHGFIMSLYIKSSILLLKMFSFYFVFSKHSTNYRQVFNLFHVRKVNHPISFQKLDRNILLIVPYVLQHYLEFSYLHLMMDLHHCPKLFSPWNQEELFIESLNH